MLNIPWVYSLSQFLIAPGFKRIMKREIQEALRTLPSGNTLLDVGCGPSSYLWWMGLRPVGIDISGAYTRAFNGVNGPAIAGSADLLPVKDNSFDGVWSLGLLHHMPDEGAKAAINEMMRAAKRSGYIVIFDAVLPKSAWHRPIAMAIRKADRGRFMRQQEELEALFPDPSVWSFHRVTYSYSGLEGLFCIYNPSKRAVIDQIESSVIPI